MLLTEAEVAKIREIIDRAHRVEGDLRREVSLNIKRLVDLGAIVALAIVRAFLSWSANPFECSHS